jgi:uncharacterized protein YdeI (YjbR/CyaY-like superfamily)
LTGEDGIAPAFYATPDAWRAWLEAHHAGEREHWVGFHKRNTSPQAPESITWPEAVDQALCFGWIDGIRRRVDETSYAIRFTPRKRTSRWSMVNVRRVGELREAGLMRPAGIAAFEARSAEGTYSYEQRDAAAFDPHRERRLRANAAAWAFFSAQPPWYRRTATHWVMSAKREETRDRRLARLIEDSAAGRPTGPLARP